MVDWIDRNVKLKIQEPMETFDVALLIISAVLLFMLVFLLIRERRYRFIENSYEENEQEDGYKFYKYFEEKKASRNNSVKRSREFLDFSGGRWGI